MSRFEDFHSRTKVSVICAFAVCTVGAIAQTDSEIDEWFDEFDKKVEFTIMNEVERQSYQQKRAQEIKEKLATSQLSAEHQDLIAKALSKFQGGVPIGSYSKEVVERSSREKELFERISSISILDTGFVKVDESRETPLSTFIPAFSPFELQMGMWDHSSGKVVKTKDATITFRFDEFAEISREGEEFDEAFETISNYLRGMELVAEITIDMNSETVVRYSQRLLRSFGKMFVFRLRKFDEVREYQFLEECACMVVTSEVSEFSASAIIIGRYQYQNTTTYSDMKFDKPLRYILPDQDGEEL